MKSPQMDHGGPIYPFELSREILSYERTRQTGNKAHSSRDDMPYFTGSLVREALDNWNDRVHPYNKIRVPLTTRLAVVYADEIAAAAKYRPEVPPEDVLPELHQRLSQYLRANNTSLRVGHSDMTRLRIRPDENDRLLITLGFEYPGQTETCQELKEQRAGGLEILREVTGFIPRTGFDVRVPREPGVVVGKPPAHLSQGEVRQALGYLQTYLDLMPPLSENPGPSPKAFLLGSTCLKREFEANMPTEPPGELSTEQTIQLPVPRPQWTNSGLISAPRPD